MEPQGQAALFERDDQTVALGKALASPPSEPCGGAPAHGAPVDGFLIGNEESPKPSHTAESDSSSSGLPVRRTELRHPGSMGRGPRQQENGPSRRDDPNAYGLFDMDK